MDGQGFQKRGPISPRRANVRTTTIYWEFESQIVGLAQVLCDRLHEYEILS